MKLIKKINNNFAIAQDNNNEEIVVYGKGIGFNKMPCTITDLSVIDRTYYNVDPKYYALVPNLSSQAVEITIQIVDECKMKIRKKLNPNLLFSLADHIDFAIARFKRNEAFHYPMFYDMQQYYSLEMEIAEHALCLINKKIGVKLPKSEMVGIATNIVNAEMQPNLKNDINSEELIVSNITGIIQNHFSIKIDRDSVNYARYVTHLHYLLERLENHTAIQSENLNLTENAEELFPKEYACVEKIASYLEMKYETELSKEEKLYLMLHINRLCVREGL